MKVSDQLIKFWPSCAPGKGSAAGRKFLVPPYYNQCAVFASLWALFSLLLFFVVVVVCLCMCASDCVVECRICSREVAGSNLGLGYFAPRSTQPSIPPGSVNEYQLRQRRQKAGIAHSACRWNAGCAGCHCVIPWQCVLYLSALETLRVEAQYKSATFTFTFFVFLCVCVCEYRRQCVPVCRWPVILT